MIAMAFHLPILSSSKTFKSRGRRSKASILFVKFNSCARHDKQSVFEDEEIPISLSRAFLKINEDEETLSQSLFIILDVRSWLSIAQSNYRGNL